MSASPEEAAKRAAAQAALEHVEPGEPLGLGSGSTVAAFIQALGASADQPSEVFVASAASLRRARDVGLTVVSLGDSTGFVYVDGADEVDPHGRTIKGGGGAHTGEKLVASAARSFVCIVDERKPVDALGGAPVPLEVLEDAVPSVLREVRRLGGSGEPRADFVTDRGNVVVDVTGLDLSDPERTEMELDAIPGVIECGLFARVRADVVVVGAPDGSVRRLDIGSDVVG